MLDESSIKYAVFLEYPVMLPPKFRHLKESLKNSLCLWSLKVKSKIGTQGLRLSFLLQLGGFYS